MSVRTLPDSGITSMVMGDDIYAYAQTYEGDIYQFMGNVENSTSRFYISRRKSTVIIERLRGITPKPDAPKLFSPLAAVSFNDYLNRPMSERVGNSSHL